MNYRSEEREEEFRKQGFDDSRNGIYFPEHYAKGWARDAYREGRDQWVEDKAGRS